MLIDVSDEPSNQGVIEDGIQHAVALFEQNGFFT